MWVYALHLYVFFKTGKIRKEAIKFYMIHEYHFFMKLDQILETSDYTFLLNSESIIRYDRFLLHRLQLHNIKTIMCYGCFMTKEVWWKILLEFRSIGMNRSFATKMWVFVPYIYCRHLAWIVLWVFIKGNKSKLTCTDMLPFRRKYCNINIG